MTARNRRAIYNNKKEKTMEEKDYTQEVGTESMTEEEKEKIAAEAEPAELTEGEEIDTEADDEADSDPITA